MPWISSVFSNPFVTPSTILETSERVRPWSARSSPRSVGRFTSSSPSDCSTEMRVGTLWVSSPSGPLTMTRPGESDTLTPAGTGMGSLPIRLMRLPDEAHHFAADAQLLRRPARDEPARRGDDRRAHAAEDARQALLLGIDTAARLRDPLQVGDDPLAVPTELELDGQSIEGLAALDAVIPDVALLLQEARDLDLHARRRHRDRLLERLVGVPDARQHVGDGVGQHGYQLAFVMPGIAPSCASSRRQIRHRPNRR